MGDWLKIIAAGLIILFLLGGSCVCSAYRYSDCKKVGHATWYCMQEFIAK
jgi:hypothetical protein